MECLEHMVTIFVLWDRSPADLSSCRLKKQYFALEIFGTISVIAHPILPSLSLSQMSA
jgi:hypothetical protein